MLVLGRSGIEGLGLFAAEAIPRRRVVIEYTGEWIDQAEADIRMCRGRCYLFEWDRDWVIDGAVGGSGAEYANHGCEPNLAFRRFRRRLLLVSLREVAAGEELTVDYQLIDASEPQPCHCGSPRCRGWINPPAEALGLGTI